MKHAFLLLLGIFLSSTILAQKKVVVIGSSTAAGVGVSDPSFAFVNRLATFYAGAGHTFTNLAVSGTNTYNALAESVPGKPEILSTANITAALNTNPDIIIVSYPTNDVNLGFTNEETINNLKSIEAIALGAGKTIFFVGNQPRNFTNLSQRMQLETQNAMVRQAFPNNSINVYPDLVNTTDYTISATVSAGDGIHVNNEGHRRIFQKVVDFNIFQSLSVLPVTLSRFQVDMVRNKALVSWETKSELNNKLFRVERSADGTNFSALAELPGKGDPNKGAKYTYTDNNPLPGKNYYRLQQEDKDLRKQYSSTVALENSTSGIVWKLFPVPATDKLNLSASFPGSTRIHVTLITMEGRTALSVDRKVNAGYHVFAVPVQNLTAGRYLVKLDTPEGSQLFPFIKQ